MAFEGGGGKGFAYLGALRALTNSKVLKYISPTSSTSPTGDGITHSRLDPQAIRGVGGASAGAITAFLVSIGYTTDELAALMGDASKFLAFFDGGFDGKDASGKTVKRLRPIYGGSEPVKEEYSETVARQSLKTGLALGAAAKLIGMYSLIALQLKGLRLPDWIFKFFTGISGFLDEHRNQPPFDVILANWPDLVVNFNRDLGLFAGASARSLFDQLLADRMPLTKDGKRWVNATFEDHYAAFNVELLVTGTNLATGKSVVFSYLDTPKFYVADAIRISMGIPFAFKPVIIQEPKSPRLIPGGSQGKSGVWVDGGLLNNIPFREFNDRPGDNPKTLALRLEFEPTPTPINDAAAFIKAYVNLIKVGTGEAYVTSAHGYQTIVFDTTGLHLLDFSPDKKVSESVQTAAEKATNEYFKEQNRKLPSYFEPPYTGE